MQLYDITIAANTTRQLDAPGSYFYYYSGSAGGADSTITLRGLSSGLRITLKPGQAFRLPAGQSETSWVMTNSANVATIIGTVIVGDGDITDNRVTGSVEVVDGGKARTQTNSSFFALSEQLATAGQYSINQLWNPLASGKNVFIEQILMSSLTASMMTIKGSTAAIGSASSGTPKKINGTSSVSELRNLASATAPTGNAMSVFYMAANGITQIKFAEPMQLVPGTGLVVYAQTQNTTIDTTFEFFEESAS